ncbi:unnamed protein product, partial [Soboliphyme baturini]|uniref:Guanine nucleotide-binding protein subunit gamma 3-like n=1 Tax=Soboliphyme baturini TaxID=241478 RepID=A0A183J8W6_9BILA
MQSWIDIINFTAACFSSPVLPAPVSSRQSFHRPLLPSTASKLTMDEQLKVHTTRIAELEKCLDQLRDAAPVPTSKSRVLQDYAQKEIFLLYE